MEAGSRTILWWSRSGHEYSRNRIVRKSLQALGWTIVDFRPLFSAVGDLEAALRRVPRCNLVWVPCFRQRDAAAALRWAGRRRLPCVFDPLISAWDKQVFEQARYPESSAKSQALKEQEGRLMRQFDLVIADTHCHADFFRETFGVPGERLSVVPVGAEESLFVPQPARAFSDRIRVLFYGSFIGLQGPEVIARAAAESPFAEWTFVGDGPLRAGCEELTRSCSGVRFISWIPYEELPAQIGSADVLLGVFGSSQKAGRVIPNKVYQSLACGRPVVTQQSDAYPESLRQQASEESGVTFIEAGAPEQISATVRSMMERASELAERGLRARRTYERYFSEQAVRDSLVQALGKLGLQ